MLPSLTVLLLAATPAPQAPLRAEFPASAVPATSQEEAAAQLAAAFLARQGIPGTVVLERDLGDSATARRLVYEHRVAGVPVRGDVVKVVLFHRGGATVAGRVRPVAATVAVPAILEPAARAAAAASAGAGERLTPLAARLAWDGEELVWEIRVQVRADGTWEEDILVDATTGLVRERLDLRRFGAPLPADGQGLVFDPNPVQTSGNHNLTDQGDSNAAVPNSGYFPVTLRDLDGSGYLQGPWCSTAPTANRAFEPTLQFLYHRRADAFEEVMTYYHIDAFQRYLQAIGQPNANRRQQEVDVNGTRADNSWYSEGSRQITYGSGGVDDAEDADIILHEYGHALHDDVQGGIGNRENGAMSEGYGDYFAASFYDDPLVGEWDAVSYTGGPIHYLRRVDTDLHYPEDKNGQVHHDGQIWAAMLWDLRMALGGPVADNLIVEAMALQSRASNMPDGGHWLLVAEQQLYGGAWQPYVAWALGRRGIRPLDPSLPVLTPGDTSPVAGTATTLELRAPGHAGRDYQVLASLQPGPHPLPPPWNVTLQVGLDLLQESLAAPGFHGTLPATAKASIPLAVPAPLAGVPVAFQAAILDASGGILDLTVPCALRAGIY